jgi:hypothetical protein
MIRMIKSRRMIRAGHVAGVGEEECLYDISGSGIRKETTRRTKM